MGSVKKRYNILFITHDSRMYGANQSLLNLINGLGNQVNPYVLIAEDGPLVEELKKAGIKYFSSNYKQCGWWINNLKSTRKWVVLLKRIRAYVLNRIAIQFLFFKLNYIKWDIVHSNSSVVDIGPTLAQKFRCKHIWHFREFQDLDHGFQLYIRKNKFISYVKQSGQIICITSSVAKHFDLNNYATVIFNAVRHDVPLIQLEKQNYFIFCGAVKKQKGIEDALKALHIVLKSGGQAFLKVVGGIEKSYESELYKIISNYKLESNVEILGFRKDVDNLIANAKALLMCSKNEAMGRVTVEAMLLGCPVIGYNNQGTAELLKHEQTGFLYNSVTELSEHMISILHHKYPINEIINHARVFAQSNFLNSVAAEKVIKVYETPVHFN